MTTPRKRPSSESPIALTEGTDEKDPLKEQPVEETVQEIVETVTETSVLVKEKLQLIKEQEPQSVISEIPKTVQTVTLPTSKQPKRHPRNIPRFSRLSK